MVLPSENVIDDMDTDGLVISAFQIVGFPTLPYNQYQHQGKKSWGHMLADKVKRYPQLRKTTSN